jgi:hypothetical protein
MVKVTLVYNNTSSCEKEATYSLQFLCRTPTTFPVGMVSDLSDTGITLSPSPFSSIQIRKQNWQMSNKIHLPPYLQVIIFISIQQHLQYSLLLKHDDKVYLSEYIR